MEKEFKPNSAFKSKYSTEITNLKSELTNELIEELHCSLSDDFVVDTNMHLKDESCICKHSCIIKSLAPSLIPLFGEGSSKSFLEDVFVENQKEKEKLLVLYGLDKKNYKHVTDVKDLIIEDFKKLLQTEEYSDVMFEIQENVQIGCHKCILLSRCQYFAMMLSGNWVENEKTVIRLEGISSKVFQFILSFIYTADTEIPSDVNLSELIFAEDMYNIKGLNKVIQFHIRSNYLHFFHSPCQSCIAGSITIYNILTKVSITGYGEILEKIFAWYVKSYCKILNNRAFSRASKQLCKAIFQKIKESINSVNIIAHFKDCNKLKSSLPNVQWANRVKGFVEDLELYLMSYASNNFERVTSLPGFMFCLFQDKNVHMNKMLQDMFLESVKRYLSVENSLDIYIRTKEMEKQLNFQKQEIDLQDSEEFVKEMLFICKKFIQSHIMQLQRTSKWKELESYVKNELKANSGFIDVDTNDVKNLKIKK